MQATPEKVAALQQFKKSMEGLNDFEVLGVPLDCNDSAVRSSYFKQVKKYGADFFIGCDADVMEDVNVVNKRLKDAYDHLKTAAGRQSAIEAQSAVGSSVAASSAPEANDDPIDMVAVFEADHAVTRARNLMERGDYAVALKHLRTALSKDKGYTELDARIAFCEFMTMDLDSNGKREARKVEHTREVLAKAISEMKTADYLYLYMGELEKLEDNTDKALEYYNKAYALSRSPSAQREIKLIESRKNNAKAEAEAPKSFFEQVKLKFKELMNKKL